ncbi:MAG TPA: hypothetical protein VLO11_03150 [Luteolibacter sp.]|nr:hypothetical protein [Luteolibacter sp.]
MNTTPSTGERPGMATFHSTLIRQHCESRRPNLQPADNGRVGTEGNPPVARPLPQARESTSAQDATPQPQITSTVALLALLFGRR